MRGFDGTLTTYSYVWSGTPGTSDFVTTITQGPESSSYPGTVAAGTQTVIKTNSAGQVWSTATTDLESGVTLDSATAPAYQNGTPFPSTFSRPLGTTEQYAYDGQGRVTSYTDNLGIGTTYARDALGRLTQTVRGSVTGNISYNTETGSFGPFITWSATGQSNRTRDEETSPFGLSQSVTITGPENSTTSRTVDANANTVTTTVQNFFNL